MTGYLMNFFKYAAIDTDDFEDNDQLYLNAHGGESFVRSVVWSVFDRIEIREINTFEEFRLSQYSEKKWVGERQFTLLYEISPDKSHLKYQKSEDKCLFAFHKVYEEKVLEADRKTDEEKYRFFGISMIDLAPEVHHDFYATNQPGEKMYKTMRKLIEELCFKNGISDEKLCFELYGTLGGNDLVVIWLSNEFKDVVTVLEALRMSQIKGSNKSIVANVATIMGLRDINNANISYENVEGQLNIRFTKKGTYNHEEFKSALDSFLGCDVRFETTLGEHDLSLRLPGIELTKRIYNDSGFIHIRNKKFLENIIQANTELSVKIDYTSLSKGEYKLLKNFNRTIISLEQKEEVFNDIEDIVNDSIFQELPYLKETLWILYEDYLRNISSSFSYPWISDLHYQFSASMNYLKELVHNVSVSKTDKYKVMRELISTIRQTILHVSQANRLFFEIPNTHLKNTGSYSKVLRTYYGIVKQLLTQAYCIPKHGNQATIVPFITFDVTPKIMSTMLPQLKKCENVIINIVLPYEALVDIPKYSKLLAHEVFHYIAPTDRNIRNTEIGILSVSLFISQIIMCYIDEIVDNVCEDGSKRFDLKPYKDQVSEKCLKYVISHYKELMAYVPDYNSNDEWEKYFSKLDKVFSNRSAEFTKLEELQARIFAIYNEIANVQIKDIGLKGIGEEELKKIEDALQDETKDKFVKWLIEKGLRKTTCLAEEVKYALREIAPDYFMLQVMKRTEWEKNYYQLILYYKQLLTTDEVEMRQLFRVGIMTDYLFSDITDNLGRNNAKEVIEKLKSELGAKTNISEEMQCYVIKCFIQYYETLKQYRKLMFLYIKDMDFGSFNTSEFEKKLKKTKELLDDRAANDFQKSVQYVERFQVQDELAVLSNCRKVAYGGTDDAIGSIRKELGIELLNSISQQREGLFAWDVNSLVRQIDRAAKEISDGTEPVWFRGHRSYKYKLLPSLYRMKDEKLDFYKGISLRDIMEPLFKSFKVRAFGAKEIFEGGDNSRIGILVSMQHYSVPTNILDWTPSAFTALYFAIEDYMVHSEKERRERKVPNDDAEIWVLNPIRLNKARALLTSRKIDEGTLWEYPIPSIYENEEEYKEYIPFSTKKEPGNVPVAVYVPHVNQRIKAQLGTFTMFSLDSEGKETEDGKSVRFSDLVEIQDKYKEKVKEEEYAPFLSSIRISKNCLLEVADWLRRMGVTKPNVYPELSNISKSLTGEIRDYWEKKENSI